MKPFLFFCHSQVLQPWAGEVDWPALGCECYSLVWIRPPDGQSHQHYTEHREVILQNKEGKQNLGRPTDCEKKQCDYVLLKRCLWWQWEDEVEGIWINLD